MIEFRNVSVCYAPQARHPIFALDDIDLHIARGEWVFFVGPSGAGKSTLMKLVYHGAVAHRGRVWVDGEDITQISAREIPFLRRKIGVVFQDFQLLPQKTVWENVAFAQQVIGVRQKQLVRDVPRAIETVGLSHKGDAFPHQLSGGEQQRVAIARAIVNKPSILVADEPTGNLDPQTARDIGEVLSRISAGGTTILMATHDRSLVNEMAKRVVRICDGKIISDENAGVYHIEDFLQDDAPRRDQRERDIRDEETAHVLISTTALDGVLNDLLSPALPIVDEDRVLEVRVEAVLAEEIEPQRREDAEILREPPSHQEHQEHQEIEKPPSRQERQEFEEIETDKIDLALDDCIDNEVVEHEVVEPETAPEIVSDETSFVEEIVAPRLTRNGYLEPSELPVIAHRDRSSTR